MKLSVTGLACDLPAGSTWASPGLTPTPAGVAPKSGTFRAVRMELDDDDIPTRLHRPERARASLT